MAEGCEVNDSSGVTRTEGSAGAAAAYRFGGWLFSDGFGGFGAAAVGARSLSSDAGSSASAMIVAVSAMVGYQWFWRRGFHLWLGGGYTYRRPFYTERNFASGESEQGKSYIRESTRAGSEFESLILLGWAF